MCAASKIEDTAQWAGCQEERFERSPATLRGGFFYVRTGDLTMTDNVTNEDLQRQLNDQKTVSAEINGKLEKLIELSTGQQLQGQALAELQKQFGTYLDRYSTNDIAQWGDINKTKEQLTSLRSKIHGGAIVLGFFQVLIVGMISWTLETVISDHTMIAVHESKLTEQGGELQALRHLTGN